MFHTEARITHGASPLQQSSLCHKHLDIINTFILKGSYTAVQLISPAVPQSAAVLNWEFLREPFFPICWEIK